MDRVEGAAQGIANGAIDIANGAIWVANTFANPSPTDGSPYIPQFNNIGNATDKNDFIAGQNGGSIFIAGTTAMLGGPEAGGGKAIVEGGEKLLQAGAEDATKAAGTKVVEAPKPVESPAPGAESAKKVHGNSDQSQNAQHVYELPDKSGGTQKYGISGKPLNKDGSSPRANAQVGPDTGTPKIVATVPAGPGARVQAKAIEKQKVNDYAAQNGGKGPPKNKLPKPDNQDTSQGK